MKRALLLALGITPFLFLTGCATTDDHPQDQQQAHVNNLPWDRPENYEGQGPLGAFGNQINTH